MVGQESDDQQGGQPFSVHKLGLGGAGADTLGEYSSFDENDDPNYVPGSALFEAILIG